MNYRRIRFVPSAHVTCVPTDCDSEITTGLRTAGSRVQTNGPTVITPGAITSIAAARRGLSLFELVFVLAIMTIIGAMALPRYANSLCQYRAAAGAKRLAADISYARARAASTSASQQVVFDNSIAQYKMPGIPDVNHPSSSYVVNLAAAPYKCTIKVIASGSNSTITFNGYGTADSDCIVDIQCGEAKKTVVLDRASGQVSVQ